MTELKPSSPGERDWAQQGSDLVLRYVDTVRDKTTKPMLKGARVVVYGVIAGTLGFVALVALSLALFRGIDRALPGQVWSTYLVFGGFFFLAGLFVFAKRRPPATQQQGN